MRKFTFLRKKIEAKDRALQENLVQKYFDELDLTKQTDATGFDNDAVYNRITQQIDAMPAEKSNNKKKWIAAASVIAVLATAGVLYQKKNQVMDVVSPIAQKQLVTAGSQVANLTLSDGTKVWLNGGSKLSYPETFRGDKREVTITGEAFLEVTHNDKMPFIVHSGKVRTQVLGTSFNIKAYPNENFVKVDVATGKVGVMAPAQKTVFLTPQQEAVLDNKNGKVTTAANVDVNALTGWRDGSFIVKNMPLAEVLNVIQRRFGVLIKADNNLSQCSITANFTNVSLQNVMKIISKLVKGRAIQGADGSSYQLKGKGC
ncbi:FecR domain-containing protein [Mucilaginibacter sp. 21P]|uniref:FecR family protein n=1 Tax=Mucilaginibacter sp. 21P TaxID=2778902 RepID=UPI001C5A40B7|nr:FecR family protein [Mucilaginibacter sp. 21P]QXV64679.1 FecR domain-containing protein [Mucilaginibacter sp. 21P]